MKLLKEMKEERENEGHTIYITTLPFTDSAFAALSSPSFNTSLQRADGGSVFNIISKTVP